MNAPNGSAPTPSPAPTFQRLLNRVAIVTGASSGLGRAIALAYHAEGAKVVCADLELIAKAPAKEGDIKPTHEVIIEKGGSSLFVKCDVTDSQDVQGLVERTVQEYGRLDIMMNNAGIAPESARGTIPVYETEDSVFDLTMRVNTRSVFLGCKHAGRQMMKQDPYPSGDRGWIINTASTFGLVGTSGAVAYTGSKGAVVQMTKSVALDYAPHRIHCNAICPGFSKTSLTQSLREHPPTLEYLNGIHPFKGLGEPEDIAKVAVFLASDDASWISGVPLPVDGGYVAR